MGAQESLQPENWLICFGDTFSSQKMLGTVVRIYAETRSPQNIKLGFYRPSGFGATSLLKPPLRTCHVINQVAGNKLHNCLAMHL
jgi:hypothetical protein